MRNEKGQFIKGYINPNIKYVIKNCLNCNNQFNIPQYRKNSAKYCCKKCFKQHKNQFGIAAKILELFHSGKNLKEIMEITGKKYSHVISTINRKRFRTSTYGQGYTANIIKLKKNKSCEICNESRVLDACHIIPACEGGDISEDNILIMCPTHHRLFDSNKLINIEYEKIKEKVEKQYASKIASTI